MPEDDPEALEVVLKYLYSLSPDCLVIEKYPILHNKFSEGYLVLLVDIFRLAEKVFLNVLAEHILNYMTHPMICITCQEPRTPDSMTSEEREYWGHDPCVRLEESPVELIKAIVACEDIGPSDFAIQLRDHLYEQAASSSVWHAYQYAEGDKVDFLTVKDKKSLASIDTELLPYPHIKNKIMAAMYLNWDREERKCTELTKELKLERDKIARYERFGAELIGDNGLLFRGELISFVEPGSGRV